MFVRNGLPGATFLKALLVTNSQLKSPQSFREVTRDYEASMKQPATALACNELCESKMRAKQHDMFPRLQTIQLYWSRASTA